MTQEAAFPLDFAPPARGPFSAEAIFSGVAGAMETNGKGVGVFVPVAPCGSRACAGDQVELGEAHWVRVGGLIDLFGTPTVLHHEYPGPGFPRSLSDGAVFPVAVLITGVQSEDGASTTRLLLVDVRAGSEQVLLAVGIEAHQPDGGGFTTIGSIMFEDDGEGLPLRLVMNQTAMPSPGDEPFMPGAPLETAFRLVDGAFRSVR